MADQFNPQVTNLQLPTGLFRDTSGQSDTIWYVDPASKTISSFGLGNYGLQYAIQNGLARQSPTGGGWEAVPGSQADGYKNFEEFGKALFQKQTGTNFDSIPPVQGDIADLVSTGSGFTKGTLQPSQVSQLLASGTAKPGTMSVPINQTSNTLAQKPITSQASPGGSQTSSSQSYKIKAGDTLSKLAAKYGTTVDALMKANPNIKDPNLIYTGASLNIPSAQTHGNNTTTSGTNVTNGTGGGSTISGGSTGTTGGGGGTTTSTTGGVSYNPDWASRGITQDKWNSLNANQQAVMGLILDALTSIVQNTGSTVSFADAQKAAASDPSLLAKYSDALSIDRATLLQTLQQVQTAVSTQSQQQQTQFEADRKALAEQSAAAGQAYSGFRGKAQEDLSQQESAVVQSSRSQIQKQLQDATTAFEQKYGTSATTPSTASFVDPFAASNTTLSGLSTQGNTEPSTISGTLIGGITGTQPVAKQQDIDALAAQSVQLGKTPKVIQA